MKEFTLYDAWFLMKRKFRTQCIVSTSLAMVCFFSLLFIDKSFQYETLIRSGKIDIEQTPLTSSNLLSGKIGSVNLMKQEVLSYINFKYGIQQFEQKPDEYLDGVDDVSGTDHILLRVRGRTLELAKAESRKIYDDVLSKFRPTFELSRKNKLAIIEYNGAELEKLMVEKDEIVKSMSKIGFNPILQGNKFKIDEYIKSLTDEKIRIELMLNSDLIKDFDVLGEHPSSMDPIFPKPLLTSIALFLICFVGLYFLFIAIEIVKFTKTENE